MKHLDLDERLALIEAGTRREHPHLVHCARCRAEVEAARAALADARAVIEPEPSPLFWDGLSRRISERVAAEGPDRMPIGWPFWRALVPLTAAVAALLIAVGVDHGTRQPPVVPSAVEIAAVDSVGRADGAGTDDEWDLLGHLAGEFDFETLTDSLGTSGQGAVGSAVWELSERERVELAVLMRAEWPQ